VFTFAIVTPGMLAYGIDSSFRIDEALVQPRACDPIHLQFLARDPFHALTRDAHPSLNPRGKVLLPTTAQHPTALHGMHHFTPS
jgi:hypothetical protein